MSERAVLQPALQLRQTVGAPEGLAIDDDEGRAEHPAGDALLDLGGELAMPDYQALQEAEVERLEAAIDLWNEELGPLRNFILPGGSRAVAQAHVCRSLARGAERRCQHLNAVEPLRPVGMAYVNRLSDLLFVAARLIARRTQVDEVLWQAAQKP